MREKRVFSDSELLQQLIGGDEEAFLLLYNHYHRAVFAFVVKYVNSKPLAEDLVQEVFIKIWERKDKLQHVQSLRAYLFATARNHTLNGLKKAFKSEVAMGEVINAFVESRNETEEHLLDKEYVDFLQKVLASLPERSREIFRLCREQSKSYEEVAEIMGISRNAVKNHMVFSLKTLRASAEKDLGISLSIFLTIINI